MGVLCHVANPRLQLIQVDGLKSFSLPDHLPRITIILELRLRGRREEADDAWHVCSDDLTTAAPGDAQRSEVRFLGDSDFKARRCTPELRFEQSMYLRKVQ